MIGNEKKETLILILHLLVFIIIFLAFFPPIYSIEDEANYFGMAYVFKKGTIFPDVARVDVYFSSRYNGHFISLYPPGTSLLLLAFTYLGWRYLFLANLLVHLIGFVFFYKIVKRLGYHPIYSLLYLYFPAAVLYSRTLMSDIPAMVATVMGFYFYLKGGKNFITAGTLFGASCLFRHTNLILFSALLGACLMKCFSNERALRFKSLIAIGKAPMLLVAGFVPWAVLVLIYNYVTVGEVLTTPHKLAGAELRLSHFLDHFPFYLISLILIYPLMFFSPFVYRRDEKVEVGALALSLPIFSSFHYYLPRFGSGVQSLIVGARFLLPSIPFFLIAYIALLTRLSEKRKYTNCSLLMLLNLLVIPYALIAVKHQTYLKHQANYRDVIYKSTQPKSMLICDGEIPKLIQPIWGERKYQRFIYEDREMDVEPTIRSNLENQIPVYVVTRTRPDRELQNAFTLKYRERILQKYNCDLIKRADGFGVLEIYRISTQPRIRAEFK